MPWYIKFILQASVTEASFSDRNFCLWQNKFFDRNFFFLLWPKYISLTETRTELVSVMRTCILKEKIFSIRIFCLTETCVCDMNLFSLKEIFFLSQIFFCCSIFFLWPNLVLSKCPFWCILYMISREKFPWEIGVSVISDTRDTHFVEPCPPHPPQKCAKKGGKICTL